MKCFLVEFKPKDKSDGWSNKIHSQDQKTAEKWGEVCLSAQKKDASKYRIIVTEVVATEQPKEENVKNEENQKVRKTTKKSKNQPS